MIFSRIQSVVLGAMLAVASAGVSAADANPGSLPPATAAASVQAERLAMALVNKGVTLGALDRPEEELAAYEEVLRRFGDSELPALQEQVAKALFYKARAGGARG